MVAIIIARRSKPQLSRDRPSQNGKPVGSLPEQALGFTVQLYGVKEFSDLFTSRQLVALTTFSDLVHDARKEVIQDALKAGLADDDVPLREGGRGACAYGEAVSVYLAFAISRAADKTAVLCLWNTVGEKIEHVFGRQIISMVWDYAEANLFSNSTGNWLSHIDWIWKAIDRLPAHFRGHAIQADAAQMKRDTVILSTDPPYYDNIGYANLSDFFYVWMRKSLRGIYPDEYGTMLVPKTEELVAEAARHETKEAAKSFFENGMLDTFSNIRNFATKDYPLSVYYAFKQQDAGFLSGGKESKLQVASTGWETMLTSLIDSGFTLTGTWPMRTERRGRMRAQGSNALASSIILVCRPRPEEAPTTSRRRFLDVLRAEIPAAIAEMKTGSIAPVDLAQASIGPGMAIYSRYSAVLEADGTPLTVRTALGLINAALDEALEEQDAQLDPETRFAVDWFTQYGHLPREFGQADVLARAKNTSVKSVELAGLVESAGGKARLIHWKEYDPGAYDPRQDKRPTVWEATHHLIESLSHHGEVGAAALYNKLPGDIPDAARDLAYRLYHICERKGWAEDALDYNVLVSSWSEISRLAGAGRDSGTQAKMEMN